MNFTGTNSLYIPRVPQMTYLFKDIIVNSTGAYSFGGTQFAQAFSTGYNVTFFTLSGNRIIDPSGQFLATYNTGEAFSVSGWFDYNNNFKYISVGTILSRTAETTTGSGYMGVLRLTCPSNGSLACDIKLYSPNVSTSMVFYDYNIDSSASGIISTSTPTYANGGTFQFYQSYENLLTGNPLLAFLDPNYPVPVFYVDNDSSFLDQVQNFDYHFNTSYADIINTFYVNRTGLHNSGVYQILNLTTDSGFSGLFDGAWSGNKFAFSDIPASMAFNFQMMYADQAGNQFPITGLNSVSIPSLGTTMQANYITGFNLTSSGQYLYPPVIATTGYYYVTGLQQALNSMLFSSGCTGNIPVSFTNTTSYGAGASGQLQLIPVTFSGVYSAGLAQYNIVAAFITSSVGTGYTVAPRANVQTGAYGSNCYDVVKNAGFNYGFFLPFNTSGTMDVQAGYFTGVPLLLTGLVSGGQLTGYFVTGIDVYNIGTGYSSTLLPLLTFVRTGETGLAGQDAAGTLLLNSTSVNSTGDWSVSAGIAGQTMITGSFSSGVYLPVGNSVMSIVLSCSGVDITQPITGYITASISGVSGASLTAPFSFSKYFSTDPYALKKKLNPVITFQITDQLSFSITQSDLDTLYSGQGYTNNGWPFDPGDFDF